jgi:hypothetical protein
MKIGARKSLTALEMVNSCGLRALVSWIQRELCVSAQASDTHSSRLPALPARRHPQPTYPPIQLTRPPPFLPPSWPLLQRRGYHPSCRGAQAAHPPQGATRHPAADRQGPPTQAGRCWRRRRRFCCGQGRECRCGECRRAGWGACCGQGIWQGQEGRLHALPAWQKGAACVCFYCVGVCVLLSAKGGVVAKIAWWRVPLRWGVACA